MEIFLITQIQQIAKETTGSHFKLSTQAKSDNWTFYIYRSKILYRGPLKKILYQAIQEFVNNRTPTPKDAPRNINQPFQYLKGAPEPQKNEPLIPKKLNDSYSEKLAFSKSKGFKNVADCYYEMGSVNFTKEFKEYQSKN